MAPQDLRQLISTLLPYATIIAAMGFALAGVDATIVSLVAGGCLAAIDPRRNQTPPTPQPNA
jgi:NhaP-type Na+/H+ or K+/H+ antiporter